MKIYKLKLGKEIEGKILKVSEPTIIKGAKGLKVKQALIYEIDKDGKVKQVQNSKFNNELRSFKRYLIVPDTPQFHRFNVSLIQNRIVQMRLFKKR